MNLKLCLMNPFQVYPAEIVGKRTRVRLDGSRLHKIHLDKNQQTNIEHKVRESR